MNEFKGTPGPWKAVKAAHGPIDILDQRGRDVVTVYGGGVETESQSANSRLIAAAPDLLETLKNLVNLDQRSGWHSKEQDAALAAIAKATGSA